MNEETTKIAYHGTTRESATKILEKQTFNMSCNINDWLGRGVYFYDSIDNAILYNIRGYINENKLYPSYGNLNINRAILISEIVCKKDDILDLNDFEDLQKFLGLWIMFYDKVKNDETFKSLEFQDGYMIDWLFDNTNYFDGCKLVKNIFRLDIRFNRRINKMFNKKTRIGYNINQIFLCVKDSSCINSIKLYSEEYEKRYNIIRNVTNNLLMGGNGK